MERESLPPILQAHRGSRDLTFGAAVYRPEHAGYNNAADVARLADYLAAVRPEHWTPADLAGLAAGERKNGGGAGVRAGVVPGAGGPVPAGAGTGLRAGA